MLFFFGLIIHTHAQKFEDSSIKIIEKNKIKSTFKLNQKLFSLNSLNIDVSPQFGNLFITAFEAKKVWINLKDYYNEFDFGFNIGFNFILKEQLTFKAIYNIGMLKFHKPNIEKKHGYVVKLSIDYVF